MGPSEHNLEYNLTISSHPPLLCFLIIDRCPISYTVTHNQWHYSATLISVDRDEYATRSVQYVQL